MIFVWGAKSKSVYAGPAGTRQCQICNGPRNFSLHVTYDVHHLWYVLRWPKGIQHLLFCDHCGNGQRLTKPDFFAIRAEQMEPEAASKSPISFFDRFGWAMALGAVGVLIALIAITARIEDDADAQYAANPRAGDIYVVNMQLFLPGTPSNSIGSDYGVIRVARVADGSVTLDLPKVVSTRLGGAQRDADSRALQNDYYNEQTVIPQARIAAMHESGAITDITR
ncbi:MAG: hypothetical protein ABL909_08395 [Sphingopyxis sp.]